MKKEITTTSVQPVNASINLEGSSAAVAIGYAVLGITTLSIFAMFRGYTVRLGPLYITPVPTLT